MTDQPAPYSQEAEEAVLGAVIVNPNAFLTIASFLNKDDFFFMRHNFIWEAFARLYDRKEGVDYVTLAKELQDMGRLELIGGPAYLTQLINAAPSSQNAELYGRLVERASIRRKLIATADEIKDLARNEEMNIETVTSEVENRLFSVTDRQVKREFIPMSEAVSEYFDRIEYLMVHTDESLGVPSGFRDLDALLGGFQRSDLLIFAARPGMGKTSFLITTAVNAARFGGRVAIFTMEMGVDQFVQRMISMETGISSQQLRTGKLSQREYSRFVEAAGRVSNFPIFIDDTPALSPIQMRTKCRRLMHEHGIDLILVDYMQLMNSGGFYQNNRVQEVSFISRSLKELARELNVPMISAAQLSRAVEQRQDKRPVLSDLRESGCLAGESLVYLPDEGNYTPIKNLVGKKDFHVLSLSTKTWKLESDVVTNAFSTGIKPVYRLTTALGRTIRATGNHQFLTICGWKRLDELSSDNRIALPQQLEGIFEPTVSANRTMIYQDNSKKHNQNSSFLTQLVQSDVYWDKIVSIEPDGETEVFDLTVKNNSNFVCQDIQVHNSLEQDSDIVMFLYRDAVYNEASEFPNQADIIIAKHRNGPTGTISLYFDRTITKFMDGVTRKVDLGDY